MHDMIAHFVQPSLILLEWQNVGRGFRYGPEESLNLISLNDNEQESLEWIKF